MNIRTIDITQTLPPLDELLTLVANGHEVVLEEAGRPVARLLPAAAQRDTTTPRLAGLHEGQGWMSDDFDAPLPDEFRDGRV
jgi:antitoxin (DNA-binding transcriptional repressor) of toxin-antitoxin stability system